MTANRPTGRGFAGRSEVIARHGMAATSHPLATGIALDILKHGGSAVDAAIAANAALCLMEPTGAGVGGDLFALVWDGHARKLAGLDASGRSPRGLAPEDLADLEEIPPFGPLPVSVPGCVDGWSTLHRRYGRLPFAELLEPTIRYAEDGFPLTDVIAFQWARGARVLTDQPGFAETFLPGGRAPAVGETFRNPGLAYTLKAIAEDGRDAFYRGELAGRIDAFCRDVGCALRREDLEAHASDWEEPIATAFRGREVWQMPPPGQGLATLQMLNLLEPLDLEGLGWGSVPYLHHLIEAKKIAYEDRGRLYADPSFAQVPVETLLSKEYADRRRELIDPARALHEVPAEALRTGDTVYLAVADENRLMVSLIQSNYRGFGSGLCPEGLGFCLQDRGQLFVLGDPTHPNAYAPGKRPFHTIIPGFVTDPEGGEALCFGVMGGDMQPQGQVQVLLNHLVFGMGLQEAGDAPRFHHGGSSSPTGRVMDDGGVVALEDGFAPGTARDLALLGHRIHSAIGVFGGYQAVLYDPARDVYVGASESRKDGHAAGY